MYRGIFTRPAGQIYDNFSESIHTCPRFDVPLNWERFIGLDFGSVNTASVFLARKPGTRIYYLYRSYKAGSRTAAQHTSEMTKGDVSAEAFVCVGGSKSEEAWRQEYTATSLRVAKPDIWDLEVGINRLYRLLSEQRLVIFNDLQAVIDDIASYSRKVNERGEVLEEIDDKSIYHYCDALRYIATLLAGNVTSTASNVAPPRVPQLTPRTTAEVMLRRALPKIPGFG